MNSEISPKHGSKILFTSGNEKNELVMWLPSSFDESKIVYNQELQAFETQVVYYADETDSKEEENVTWRCEGPQNLFDGSYKMFKNNQNFQ